MSLLPKPSLPGLLINAGAGSDDDLTAGSAASNSSAERAGDDIDRTSATHGSTDASAAERKAQQHGQPPVPAPAGARAGMAGRMEGGLGRKEGGLEAVAGGKDRLCSFKKCV